MSAQLSDHDDADNRDTAEARYRLNRERMARHFREKTRVHLYHQWGEVHNCLTARKLVLRNSAELESMKMGDIAAGTRLIILEERIVDGVVRARVGRDSTPRGLAVISLGWVTAMKDGDTKLDPTLNADGSPSTWQFETFEPSSQGGEESQHAWTDTSPGTKDAHSSRLGKGSSRKRTKSSRRGGTPPGSNRKPAPERSKSGTVVLAAELDATVAKGSDSATEAAAGESFSTAKKTAPEAMFQSSKGLLEIERKLLADSDVEEAKCFDTVASKLGRLLMEKAIKVEGLMNEWDRNHDGDISKQEFRLNVRKLGLLEGEANTKELDALYESLDSDGSGALDLEEMKHALKGLQSNARVAQGQRKRTLEWVEKLRDVAALFGAAAADTVTYEVEKQKLDEMRRTLADGSPANALGLLFKKQGIKGVDVVSTWDKEGTGLDLEKFKKMVRAVGSPPGMPNGWQDDQLEQLFNSLDDDGSGALSIDELQEALKKLLSITNNANSAKATEKTMKAMVAQAQLLAETKQTEARARREEVEAEHKIAEAALQQKEEAKRAAEAKAKAEEKAAKQEFKRNLERRATKASFMMRAADQAGNEQEAMGL